MIRVLLLLCLILNACSVGPDYHHPTVSVPLQYKEIDNHWKVSKPQDDCDRGEWWMVFHDPQLNDLESQLNNSNQTIEQAKANYKEACALVGEARAAYFPVVTAAASATRQHTSSNSSSVNSINGTFNTHSVGLSASWEPDIWGGTRRNVESSVASAQAAGAQLALTRLAEQAALAQTYFQLRALDTDQKLLDRDVSDNQTLLNYAKNRYASGVDALSDVVQAQSQFQASQAASINNGIARAQFEHAAAVLIGKPPAAFSLRAQPLGKISPPEIPIEVPSTLLERRPDIAEAERQVASANAKIGVAVSAYFPTFTLSGNGNLQGRGLSHWFSLPSLVWSVGPSLAETLFDGGLRSATTKAARANYDATVANYRQVVLSGFQEVEDNLAALRILNSEYQIDDKAAQNARLGLKLVTNQYRAGTMTYADVMTASLAAFSAEKTAADINAERMTTAVTLIKALGGGWKAEKTDA